MEMTSKFSGFVSAAEIRDLSEPSSLKAAWILSVNWAIIAGAFAIAILWPIPVTLLASVVVLGGRQLGLAILMHDCSHYAFFKTKRMNNLIGEWLCAVPTRASVYAYRDYHMKHHRHAGTPKDPDRVFVNRYPVEKASLRRKMLRDLTGRTGTRDLLMRLKRFDLSQDYRCVLFHIALFAILTLAGAPWAYALWWAADLFVLPLLTRIRQIGEHGVARNRDSIDPRENTSTTLTSWWERLLIAPNNVAYHLEHHQCAGVPSYNLPKLHKLLKSRGYHDGFDCISNGYFDVLERAVREPTSAPDAQRV
ncbi:MAG: fatty acid desaturase family protein [Pseudomonadota bacterium]